MKGALGTADITPAVPCGKAGWLKVVTGTRVANPLSARALVLQGEGPPLALVVLDVLAVRAAEVAAVRRAAHAACGIPGERIMVAATHNHAGPAVVRAGDVRRDESYLAGMAATAAALVAATAGRLEEAELGWGHALEATVAKNRRVLHRDGFARTHGLLGRPDATRIEGPIDPAVNVLALRRPDGGLLGVLANYACHPTDHGGDEVIDPGWPGALRRRLEAQGIPVAIFLQGAQGNVSTSDPAGGATLSGEDAADRLAGAAREALAALRWERGPRLGAMSSALVLPYRRAAAAEIAGTIPGAQRFIAGAIYDREMPRLLAKIEAGKGCPAEVQVLRCGDHVIAGLPGEMFVESGLEFKRRVAPLAGIAAGMANGVVGYVPTREAFAHGGYETTFGMVSFLAPDAAEMLVGEAVRLARALPPD